MIPVKALIKHKEDAVEAAKKEALAAEIKTFNLTKAEVAARMESVAKAEEKLWIGRLELAQDRAKFVEEQSSFNKAKKDAPNPGANDHFCFSRHK